MLEWTPAEAREFLRRATNGGDQRIIVGPPGEDVVRILFQAADERHVYLIECQGDRDWIRELCTDMPNIETTTRLAEFMQLGLEHWPYDQSMLRMRALIDFHAAERGR